MTDVSNGVTAAPVRVPLGWRIYLIVFCAVGCSVAVGIAIVGVAQRAWVVLPCAIVWAALTITLVYRAVRVSLVFGDQDLLVRNVLSTRRVARADIRQIHIGALGNFGHRWLLGLTLRDGSFVGIDVAGRRLPYTTRGRVKIKQVHGVLEDWLNDRRPVVR